jgi:hypothetical protein
MDFNFLMMVPMLMLVCPIWELEPNGKQFILTMVKKLQRFWVAFKNCTNLVCYHIEISQTMVLHVTLLVSSKSS